MKMPRRTSSRKTTKRQPFGVLSNSPKANQTKNKNEKKKRRRSRQIGDDVVFYIQEKKTKKVYPATVVAGGLVYVPQNRKTPIAYDRHCHLLLEKTPDGEEVEIELDCEADKENIDQHHEQVPLISSAKSSTHQKQTKVDRTRPKRRAATNHSYEDLMDVDDSENEMDNSTTHANKRRKIPSTTMSFDSDIEEDYEEKTNKRQTPLHDGEESDSEQYSPDAHSKRRKLQKDNDIEGKGDQSTPFRNSSRNQHAHNLASPIAKSQWEDSQPDWRCMGAIDY